jgi:hypothetical protein
MRHDAAPAHIRAGGILQRHAPPEFSEVIGKPCLAKQPLNATRFLFTLPAVRSFGSGQISG